MSFEAAVTLAALFGAVVLFAVDKLRLDVVALSATLLLAIFGVLSPDEALAGFSSNAVVMIAGLFVIGAALTETGLADWLGGRLGEVAGEGEARLMAWVMLVTACFSAFMSSTGTVAILLPVVGRLAARKGLAPARLFLPLAFAAHLGSMLTLISTPPNLVVSEALLEAGGAPFRFFSFFPAGAAILVVGVAYLLLVGRKRLPGGTRDGKVAPRGLSADELAADYGIAQVLHTLRVAPGSPLCKTSLGVANLRARHGVNVLGITTGGEVRQVVPRTIFEAGDVLRVQGGEVQVRELAQAWGLESLPDRGTLALPPEDSVLEVVLPRRSVLAGRSLQEARFRDRYRATVLGVRRAGGELVADASSPALAELRLRVGDTLLVKGRTRHLRNLRDERRDLIVVAEPDARTDVLVAPRRAAVAVAATLGMLVVMAFGFLPNVIAVLAAALLVVLAGCVRPVDAYRAVNWESVVLIAAMLPLATALEKSGVTRMLIDGVERQFGSTPPLIVLAGLLLVTSAMGAVLSNTATAVLVAPMAVRLSQALELAPEPLLMGVAIAASASFATPMASPVNTIVLGPGGYRFADFVRVGLPLQLLALATALLVVPLVFPF